MAEGQLEPPGPDATLEELEDYEDSLAVINAPGDTVSLAEGFAIANAAAVVEDAGREIKGDG